MRGGLVQRQLEGRPSWPPLRGNQGVKDVSDNKKTKNVFIINLQWPLADFNSTQDSHGGPPLQLRHVEDITFEAKQGRRRSK